MSELGQTRSFGDVGSMPDLPESEHGWAFYEYTRRDAIHAPRWRGGGRRSSRTGCVRCAHEPAPMFRVSASARCGVDSRSEWLRSLAALIRPWRRLPANVLCFGGSLGLRLGAPTRGPCLAKGRKGDHRAVFVPPERRREQGSGRDKRRSLSSKISKHVTASWPRHLTRHWNSRPQPLKC